MRRSLGPLVALVLATCSTGNTPQAECERLAMQDPAVQDIYTRTNGDYTVPGTHAYADLQQAKRQAVLRCMRGKGLAPPGGVQPVLPQL
ncbi:MAG TPA: hypothetical protein VFE12_03805 [Acetobacteraceae bacterium]|nr:hypothetical protein [Acetobacteraceae bacterium]